MLIFHIVKERIWKEILNNKVHDDILLKRDGFIHCCTFDQLLEVANDNLKNINENLIVLCINTYYLESKVKWEKNDKNNKIFPHVYGLINSESIIEEIEFKRNENGDFFISDELFNYSKYEKSCGAVIGHKFNDNYNILLIGFNIGNKLCWGFPKGHVERNEIEIETAKREIKEEVGLNVKIIPDFREYTYFSYKRGCILEAVYYAGISDEYDVKCQEGEVDKYLWCKIEEVCDYLSFECDKIIFNNLKMFFEEYING